MAHKSYKSNLEQPFFVVSNHQNLESSHYAALLASHISNTNVDNDKFLKENEPQLRSIGAAGLILLSGSFTHTWITVNRNYEVVPYCMIGTIGGAFCTALFSAIWKRSYILQHAALLLCLSGIMIMIEFNTFGEIFSGMATGLAFVSTFTSIGEQCDKNLRGICAAGTDIVCYAFGASISYIFESPFSVGSVEIIFGFLTLYMTHFWVIESPVWHLRRKEVEQALQAEQLLNSALIDANAIKQKVIAHEAYIQYNQAMSWGECLSNGIREFLKICFLRFFVALSLSSTIIYCYDFNSFKVIFCLFGALLSASMLETYRRKSPAIKAAILGVLLASGIAALFYEYPKSHDHWAITLFLCFLQACIGGIATTSSVYLSEAFPLQGKPFYLAMALSVEKLLIVILSLYSKCNEFVYFVTLAALCLGSFVLLKWFMPETRGTTLMEAQEKFSKRVPANAGIL